MPDAKGNFKGISTTGLKNAWLEQISKKKGKAK